MTHRKNALTLAVALAVAAVVGYEIVALSPTIDATMAAADQWCTDLGGELTISHVIGETGGLHCRLPDGRLVEYQ